ncbi:MAG: M1 family metallopeptidase [Ferruginibacter sp.]
MAQKDLSFSHYDTLIGSNGEFRKHWNVLHYDLAVEPDYNTQTLRGKNTITFFDNGAKLMQIDLQQPMVVENVVGKNGNISFRRDSNVIWVMLRDSAAMYKIKPDTNYITIYFSGKPKKALNPPWDGGWIWTKDKNGNPWYTVACQGSGGSLWYPCKDFQTDKPDLGATLRITVPDSLEAIGNGRFIEIVKNSGNKKTIVWNVSAPINTYNIVPYIGKYVHFKSDYKGEKGNLDLDYWVLNYNETKAESQFAEVPGMLKAFEYWFGPYPFYKDGYKLVEAPYLGMEHQSAIAYGNGFKNGYRGSDLSKTGWGLKWDFIIVHESAHEWFGNSITHKDVADMWIHEGFTHYAEALFTEYYYGKTAGNEYVIGTRINIKNDIPVIGKYGVKNEGSGDMYYKAASMIHTIRQLINNDEKFRNLLIKMNAEFYHSSVSSAEIEDFIIKETNLNLKPVFDQYLRTINIPTLEYKVRKKHITVRWTNCVAGFNMPVKIAFNDQPEILIYPTEKWNCTKLKGTRILADSNFLVKVKKVSSKN